MMQILIKLIDLEGFVGKDVRSISHFGGVDEEEIKKLNISSGESGNDFGMKSKKEPSIYPIEGFCLHLLSTYKP
jgi:hypothetical protein